MQRPPRALLIAAEHGQRADGSSAGWFHRAVIRQRPRTEVKRPAADDRAAVAKRTATGAKRCSACDADCPGIRAARELLYQQSSALDIQRAAVRHRERA